MPQKWTKWPHKFATRAKNPQIRPATPHPGPSPARIHPPSPPARPLKVRISIRSPIPGPRHPQSSLVGPLIFSKIVLLTIGPVQPSMSKEKSKKNRRPDQGQQPACSGATSLDPYERREQGNKKYYDHHTGHGLRIANQVESPCNAHPDSENHSTRIPSVGPNKHEPTKRQDNPCDHR